MATVKNTGLFAEEALEALGISCFDELFIEPPVEVASLLKAKEEAGGFVVNRRLKELTSGGVQDDGSPCFIGGGCYDHFVPISVEKTANQSDLYTAYRTAHPDLTTKMLNAFVSYRETIARLTGMNYVNASVFCGGGVLARACLLAVETTGREVVVVCATINPDQLAVLRAYADANLFELRVVPERNGAVDHDELAKTLAEVGEEAAAIVLQYPNFYGLLERLTPIVANARELGTLTIAYVDPFALGVLKSPYDWGVDIIVGDGLPHAFSSGFTSCRLGFLALADWLIDLIPESLRCRIVDRDGVDQFGFLLQRRRKTENVEERASLTHTRETLDAAIALAYYAYTEIETIRAAANESLRLAKYARDAFLQAGFELCHDAPFLYEFGVKVGDPRAMNDYFRKWGVIGGYEIDDGILFAFTEKRSTEEVDELIYFMQAYSKN